MTTSRWQLHCPEQLLNDRVVGEVCLTGQSRFPLSYTECRHEGNRLIIEREAPGSACIHIPWYVERHGTQMLSTTLLAPVFGPYRLAVEIARGTLFRLRNRFLIWENLGLIVPPALRERIDEATELFRKSLAAVSQHATEEADDIASLSIRMSLDAGRSLADTYVEQALKVRRRLSDPPDMQLGVTCDPQLVRHNGIINRPNFIETLKRGFQVVTLPIRWRDVETEPGQFDWKEVDRRFRWAQKHDFKLFAGPLVRFEPEHLPDYLLELPEGDDRFDHLSFAVHRYIDEFIDRYSVKLDKLITVGGFNIPSEFITDQADQVQLTASTVTRSLETLHDTGAEVPVMVTIAQPWAEFASRMPQSEEKAIGEEARWLARMSMDPRMQLEALVRMTGAALGGFMLETHFAHHRGATLPRPPLEFVQMLDQWVGWEIPLYVQCSIPSSGEIDPFAELSSNDPTGDWSERSQQEWIHRYLPLMLTRPWLRGVIWGQLSDSVPHRYPHAGMLDNHDDLKPALLKWSSIASAHLK